MKSAARTNKQQRFDYLDAVKGIAIFFVVWVHIPIGNIPLPSPAISADFANTLFFIINGYLLSFSWRKIMDTPSALLNFYLRRAKRLLPFYYFVLFVVFGEYMLFAKLNLISLSAFASNPLNIQVLFWHLTFLWQIFPPFLQFNVGEWFVHVLFFLTLLFPLLFYLGNTWKKALALLAVTMGVSLYLTYAYPTMYNNWLLYYSIPRFAPAFVTGILLYHLRDLKVRHRYLYLVIGALLVLHKFVFLTQMNILISAVFIYACKENLFIVSFLNNRVFRQLGKASYSIYLLNIQVICLAAFLATYLHMKENMLVNWGLLFALSVIIFPVGYMVERFLVSFPFRIKQLSPALLFSRF